MKKIVVYIVLLVASNVAFAQVDTSALYYKYPNVPPFTITKVPDSTTFAKAGLKKNKATLIMVFSPDCDHCTHEIKELLAHMELFKNVQIILVTHLDFHYIKTFYEDYKIANYPNITVGRDYSYFFGTFFKIKFLPAIFTYNKKGKFVQAFDGSVAVQKIAASL